MTLVGPLNSIASNSYYGMPMGKKIIICPMSNSANIFQNSSNQNGHGLLIEMLCMQVGDRST